MTDESNENMEEPKALEIALNVGDWVWAVEFADGASLLAECGPKIRHDQIAGVIIPENREVRFRLKIFPQTIFFERNLFKKSEDLKSFLLEWEQEEIHRIYSEWERHTSAINGEYEDAIAEQKTQHISLLKQIQEHEKDERRESTKK